MNRITVILSLVLVLVTGLAGSSYVLATPSSDFNEVDGEIFDDWGICRTNAVGEDGFYQVSETSFRPVIAFESLGEETALAYRLGEQIAGEYPDKLQRAQAIFRFVQSRVEYLPDIDQFQREEFAQNADELAITIDRDGIGYGDCEDSAVLLAVMYRGAGYRSAIAIAPGHTAALVYLPEYDKAAVVFEMEGEPGWVWAEATGKNNYLGWVPKELVNDELAAYEVGEEAITLIEPAAAPAVIVARGGGTASSSPLPFTGIIFLLWLLPLFRRRRAR